ncbi:hypothetical protein MHM93_17285 [Pseudoalteromonas sp. MM17-2]|uniref:DUF3226 domain-containing protein n=1 Tax=Pseudoalteromonas sp. MM17-2 TaxID=2917753 RepID=UPI001EF70668|nr:DUF3226 domain-containing protein [Pseudoalteromonas sp. MM17-2]MCG7545937.1 hypothetical protein [Pseudoalteromonas sp. MM17-2]
MDRVIVVLCEGQHDIAFVSRVLKAHHFVPYNKKVKDFHKPLGKLFENILKQKDIADKKLGFQSDYKLPSVALDNGNSLILFHNMGGDERQDERAEVLDMYRMLSGNDDFSNLDFIFRFITLFDADDLGISHRLTHLTQELGLNSVLSQGQIFYDGQFEYGAYIFHSGEEVGTLEDVLLDMIEKSEEEIINNSEDFIQSNLIDAARTREYVCTPASKKYKGSGKFKHKKSKLSIAGQLQFSGMNNSVFIANTDFLTYEELTTNVHCVDIVGLFQ